jgi:nucleoside-diphosphate-sugar epimerase
MPIEIIVPRLGWSMEEGAFVAWLKKDGEFVRAGESLFSIEGDKAVQEIESIDSGILRIAVNAPRPGDPIRVGDVLGHLISEGEVPPESVSHRAGQVAEAASATSPFVPEARFAAAAPIQSPASSPRGRTISPRASRVAAELGVDWTKITGTGRSGRIRERDVRAAAGLASTPLAFTSAEPSVLVTGGCGFIGTWVVRELLKRDLRVVVLDAGERPTRWERVIGQACAAVPLVQGSLLDRELLDRVFEEHQVANVVHLAALLTPACQADPWEGGLVNIMGSLALFEQVRRRGAGVQGFCYASSVAVFGDESNLTKATESGGDHPPLTFYGAFKKAVELLAAQYWRHFKMASLGIRPQVAYGPERDSGLTAGASLAARAAARGEAFCIGYTGAVGYDYVEDVARAFVRGALETPPGAHVADLPGERADANQVIAAIAAVVPDAAAKLSANGPAIPAHQPANPCFISTLYPDWETTSLAQGIRRTVEFYQFPQRRMTNAKRCERKRE